MELGIHSLRDWLGVLRGDGGLRTVSREVDLRFELAALGKKADGKWALLFNKVKGAGMPVVTGLAGSRDVFARALGVPVDRLVETFSAAQATPRGCVTVDRRGAPVKAVVTRDVDLGSLPIPTHHEKDGGPYITAGVLIAKNPATGERNLSIHRLQVLGRNKLGILILPRHLHQLHRVAEQSDKPLDVAIAIGLDPILLLASQAIAPLGFDEYTIASALYDNPLELVKGETVDLDVPAHAEIVLEGHLLPRVRELEGPFGEYPKYYGPASAKPVIELSAMTCRSDPIYQTIVAATMEHMLLGAIPREGSMLQLIRSAVPNVRAVHLTPGGACRYHAVISIDKQNEGEAKNAMFAAFSSSQEIKRVVVVDKDVNIFDPLDVEWAIATRFQAGRDAMIVQRALGNRLDPSSDGGLSDKMGLDATVPLDADAFRFERIRIPGEDSIDLANYLD
jgi:2,5-furandicarboxylate decarboxylase 1